MLLKLVYSLLIAPGSPGSDSMDVSSSLMASDRDNLCFGAFFRLCKIINLLVRQVDADCDCVTSHLVGFNVKHNVRVSGCCVARRRLRVSPTPELALMRQLVCSILRCCIFCGPCHNTIGAACEPCNPVLSLREAHQFSTDTSVKTSDIFCGDHPRSSSPASASCISRQS